MLNALLTVGFIVTLIVFACLIVGSDDDDHFDGPYRIS